MASSSSSSSSSKRTRTRIGCEFDRLSEGILISILSFLSSKEAIRTCILSKRWVNLWKFTTRIELNQNHFLERVKSSEKKLSPAFFNFGCHFKDGHQAKMVEKFSLTIGYDTEGEVPAEKKSFIDGLLEFAASKNIEYLDLDFDNDDYDQEPSFPLPPCIFQIKTIRSVRFYACIFDPEDLAKFRLIKSLRLEIAKINSSAIVNLFKSCLFLEHLELNRCTDLDSIKISGEGLRLGTLTIVECLPLEKGLYINAPNLVSYKYYGNCRKDDHLELPSILDVDIEFSDENEYRRIGSSLAYYLACLHNAKHISVCSYITQVLPSGVDPFRMPYTLGNLRILTFKTGLHEYELPGITCILRGCPFLETVCFELVATIHLDNVIYPYGEVMRSEDFWISQRRPIYCLQNRIKTVKFSNFKIRPHEIDLLRFVLLKARVLEKVYVVTSRRDPPISSNIPLATRIISKKLKPLTAATSSRARVYMS